MWTRFFPAMEKVAEVISSGEIGDIVNVQGDFGWSNMECPFPEDRIWLVHHSFHFIFYKTMIENKFSAKSPHFETKHNLCLK